MKRLLIFHPIIAPYRIDFFNYLFKTFYAKVCLFQTNLYEQTFDYKKIEQQMLFQPTYLLEKWRIGGKGIPKGIINQIQKFKPDIILVPEVGLTTLLVIIYKFISRRKYKIVTLIDDSYEMAVKGKQYSKKHALAEKLLLPLLDDAICVEPRVATFFQQKYRKGVFFPIIADDEKQRKKYKDSLPISSKYINEYKLQNKRVLLFVGRLSPEKNLPTAIRAFIKANVENSVFIIVGEGQLRKDLEKLAENSSNIILPGRFENLELYAWYNIASAFILPSTMEAFGAVTNEALLAGCFSIVSKSAGSQCIIKEGINGLVINPNDENSISSAIQKSLSQTSVTIDSQIRNSLMQETFECAITRVINTLTK